MECIIEIPHASWFIVFLASLFNDSLWYPGWDFAPELEEHDQVHDDNGAHRDHEAGEEEAEVEHSKIVFIDVKRADVAS